MASTTPPGCRSCGESVAPGDALVVESIATGRRWLVHRPDSGRFCFRDCVGSVLAHRIAGVYLTREDLHRPPDR